MDTIFIRDLRLCCVIGINERERRVPQEVKIHVDLEIDLHDAGKRDALTLTVDYRIIRDRIEAALSQSRYYLIEALAEHIAEVCLEDPKVNGVNVCVEKPGALHAAGSVGVKISRKRDQMDALGH